MSWNENNNFNNQSPPDLDEALQKFKKQFGSFFSGGNSGGSLKLLIPILFAVILIWSGLGVQILDEKEKGVVLRLGKFHSIIGPGFNWQPAIIDQVYRAEVTKVSEYVVAGLMLTKDENIVKVPLTIQYNIKSIRDFILRVNNPIGSLVQATDSAIRHAVGSTNLDDVLGEGRALLADEVRDRLQRYLDSYGSGINVITVTLQEGQPPSAVKQAFDDVIAAKEDKDRYKNEAEAYRNGILPEARGTAQRIIEEANAYKGEVIAKADGEAQRFVKLLSEYKRAKDVTRSRLYIETIEAVLSKSSKVLIDIDGGNNMMYLPLDQILKKQQVASENRTNREGGQSDQQLRSRIVDQVIQELTNRANNRGVR